jgi:hypothetical protein
LNGARPRGCGAPSRAAAGGLFAAPVVRFQVKGFISFFSKAVFVFFPVRVFVRNALEFGSKLGLLSARQLKTECNKTYSII